MDTSTYILHKIEVHFQQKDTMSQKECAEYSRVEHEFIDRVQSLSARGRSYREIFCAPSIPVGVDSELCVYILRKVSHCITKSEKVEKKSHGPSHEVES